MSTVLSDDYAYATSPGPYSAENSTWNAGNLVNGTDFTQSLTLDNPNSPNINTTISWNFPNTPASGNVYSFPAVQYGDYNGDATTITPEQISSIKTLTLSNNVTLSGNPNNYDAIYDMGLTSTPGFGTEGPPLAATIGLPRNWYLAAAGKCTFARSLAAVKVMPFMPVAVSTPPLAGVVILSVPEYSYVTPAWRKPVRAPVDGTLVDRFKFWIPEFATWPEKMLLPPCERNTL